MARTNVTARRTGTIITFTLMLLGALTMVLPFIWMLSTSLKESRLVFEYPPQWIPDPIDWANYVEVWNIVPLATGLLNSLIVTTLVVVFGTFSSTMAAFAFAKLEFPHKRRDLRRAAGDDHGADRRADHSPVPRLRRDRLDRHPAPPDRARPARQRDDDLLPAPVHARPTNDLIDAAKIDGAGYFRIYWSIFLPLCKPAIAANVIIVFMATWNDYLGPLIFTNSPQNSTVQLVIASFTPTTRSRPTFRS